MLEVVGNPRIGLIGEHVMYGTSPPDSITRLGGDFAIYKPQGNCIHTEALPRAPVKHFSYPAEFIFDWLIMALRLAGPRNIAESVRGLSSNNKAFLCFFYFARVGFSLDISSKLGTHQPANIDSKLLIIGLRRWHREVLDTGVFFFYFALEELLEHEYTG